MTETNASRSTPPPASTARTRPIHSSRLSPLPWNWRDERAAAAPPVVSALQAHGTLLGWRDPEEIRWIGANSADFLGLDPEAVLGRSLSSVFGEDFAASVASEARHLVLERSGRHLVGRTYRVGEATLLELERADLGPSDLLDFAASLSRLLQGASSPSEVCQLLLGELGEALRAARVAVYRYDSSGRARLSGEQSQPRGSSPAPPPAPRVLPPELQPDLSGVRVVLDGDEGGVALVSLEADPTLDLSQARLCQPSAAHSRFLRELGAARAVTIPLETGEHCWGFALCSDPSLSSTACLFTLCELIGSVASQRLAALREAAVQASAREARGRLHGLLSELAGRVDDLADILPALSEVLPSEGLALWREGSCYAHGRTPGTSSIALLADWLRDQPGDERLFATHRLRALASPTISLDGACGLLALQLAGAEDTWLLWFRSEDPDPSAEDATSAPWRVEEGLLAQELRDGILQTLLLVQAGRQAELDDLARSNKELEQFARVVAHDLKAPLRALQTVATWLREDYSGKLDSTGQDHLDMLAERAGRLQELIDGVLAYSRAGEFPQPAAQNVDEVLRGAIDSLERVDLVEVTTPMPEVRYPDIQLRQIFANLLSNAEKWCESKIEVGCHVSGDEWAFFVRDDGPGVPPQLHEKIFRAFARAPSAANTEGSGVGLAIVRKLVTAAGGRLWVESQPPEGSTFWFTVPRRNLSPELGEPRAPHKRILVVEDDAVTSELIASLLTLVGYTVRCVPDGSRALTLVQTHAFDVVLIDLGLPDMSGDELARQLREQPTVRSALFIALTALSRQRDRQRAKEVGFDHFLVKPVGINDLQGLIKQP